MSEVATIEVDGYTFEVSFETDTDADPPWKREDGHGDVRISGKPHWHGEGSSDKLPGERPLNTAPYRDIQYYYDWQEACHRARVEGWNAEPYDAPNKVQRAVEADFKYLRDWIDGDWDYVCVEVTLENRTEYTRCIGGVETHNDYHLEFAEELAREVIEEYLDDMENQKLKGMYPATGANAPEGERR
jgi:hypothetical protein